MNSPIFSISPFYAAADKNLGHAAHRVLTLLCGFADSEGLCFPSRKMLCGLTGIENSNLSKYINVLCRKGYLAKTNATGNRYKIIGFKDKQWPMVECGNNYHQENQQHGNSYHENSGDGNDYHEDGNSYHEDGNDYHKKGDSVVIVTNITDHKMNRPLEQTNKQTSAPVSGPPSSVSILPLGPLPEAAAEKPKKPKKERKKNPETFIPENFSISDSVKKWAREKGYSQGRLDANFEAFVIYAKSHGKTYVDWDSALMGAVRNNWAKFNDEPSNQPQTFRKGNFNEYRKYTIDDDNRREAALARNLAEQAAQRNQATGASQTEPQRRAVFNF